MTISKKQMALLHVARQRLELSEEAFRSALVQITRKTSTTEMDLADFDAMMGFFEYLGFRPQTPQGANYGRRSGMASFAQIELIRALWREYTRGQSDEDALNIWLERYFKVSSLRFLRAETARKAITALKSMKARAA